MLCISTQLMTVCCCTCCAMYHHCSCCFVVLPRWSKESDAINVLLWNEQNSGKLSRIVGLGSELKCHLYKFVVGKFFNQRPQNCTGVDQFVCSSQNGKCWKCTERATNCDGTHYTTQQLAILVNRLHRVCSCAAWGRRVWCMVDSIEEHHAVPWSTTAVANCNVTYYVNWTQAFNLTTVHRCTYACRTVFLCLLCPSPLHLSCIVKS